MQVFLGSGQRDFHSENPSQTVCNCRLIRTVLAGITHDRNVALKLITACVQKVFQVFAANFFFSLNHVLQIDWQFPQRPQPPLGRFDMRENLTLVIGCASGIQAAIAQRRLEGRRRPEIERISGLNIVMAVDHDCRSARGF